MVLVAPFLVILWGIGVNTPVSGNLLQENWMQEGRASPSQNFLDFTLSSLKSVPDSQSPLIFESKENQSSSISTDYHQREPSPAIHNPSPILSHLATYKITLDTNSSNEEVEDANGFMTIKVWDTGDGWIFEQNSTLIVYSLSGDVEQVNTNVATWQDYGGNHYRFNSRTLRNGEMEDLVRGEAHKGAKDQLGKVIYYLPEKREISLPNETIFPLHHLFKALEKANRGELAFSNAVFDGSAEVQEAVIVDTVISYPKKPDLNLIRGVGLLSHFNKMWSMELGVYPLKGIEQEYTIKQDVLNHGIIKSMTLDYGTFQVIASLEKLDFFTSS